MRVKTQQKNRHSRCEVFPIPFSQLSAHISSVEADTWTYLLKQMHMIARIVHYPSHTLLVGIPENMHHAHLVVARSSRAGALLILLCSTAPITFTHLNISIVSSNAQAPIMQKRSSNRNRKQWTHRAYTCIHVGMCNPPRLPDAEPNSMHQLHHEKGLPRHKNIQNAKSGIDCAAEHRC